jgi:hypothetical protein
MEVYADSAALLDRIVQRARALGATAEHEQPVRVDKVAREGVFPEGFYSTTGPPRRSCSGRWAGEQHRPCDRSDRKAFARGASSFGTRAGHGGGDRPPGRSGHPARALGRPRSSASWAASLRRSQKCSSRDRRRDAPGHESGGGPLSSPAPQPHRAGVYCRASSSWIRPGPFCGQRAGGHDVESALFSTALGINISFGCSANELSML